MISILAKWAAQNGVPNFILVFWNIVIGIAKITILGYFVWGNVLYLSLDSCDDFEHGYRLTLAIILLTYIYIGALLGALFVWAVLKGVMKEAVKDEIADLPINEIQVEV